jgi:hypothetical protein
MHTSAPHADRPTPPTSPARSIPAPPAPCSNPSRVYTRRIGLGLAQSYHRYPSPTQSHHTIGLGPSRIRLRLLDITTIKHHQTCDLPLKVGDLCAPSAVLRSISMFPSSGVRHFGLALTAQIEPTSISLCTSKQNHFKTARNSRPLADHPRPLDRSRSTGSDLGCNLSFCLPHISFIFTCA